MTNETERLRRLVDARERATKGEWELQITKFPDGIKSLEIITPNYDVVSAVVRHPIRALEDAHFIALSGTLDLRAILTRMEKMEEALKPFADAATEAEKWGGAAESVIANSVSLSDCKRAKEALE